MVKSRPWLWLIGGILTITVLGAIFVASLDGGMMSGGMMGDGMMGGGMMAGMFFWMFIIPIVVIALIVAFVVQLMRRSRDR